MYNTAKQTCSPSLQPASGSRPLARSRVALLCTRGLSALRYPALSVVEIPGLSGLFFGPYSLLFGFLRLFRFSPESLHIRLPLVSIIGIYNQHQPVGWEWIVDSEEVDKRW